MEHIFIATPVAVETVGDRRRPDGEAPAIILRDSSGQVVIRIPTPEAPGGRPHLEAMAFAGAQDICRQVNEVDTVLRAAVAEAGIEDQVTVGVTAVRRSEKVIGEWHFTLQTPGGATVRVRVDPLSYDSDEPLARETARQALALLGPERTLVRR